MAQRPTRWLISLVGTVLLAPLLLGQGCLQAGGEIPTPTGNRSPQAQLGQGLALSAAVGSTVLLDASPSWDPDADRLTFLWTQTSGPQATITNADRPIASFIPTEEGTYIFKVQVSDGRGGTDSASLRVAVTGSGSEQG